MFAEARVVWMFGAQAVEKMDCLQTAFEKAERFGFEAEVQFFSGLFADARDVFDAAPEIVADGFDLVGVEMKFLERAGQGADAAFDSSRNKLCEQIEKQVRVGDTLRRSPVGPVNIFLDSRGVELAVGKSVHGEDVAIVLAEPALEG